MSEEDKYVKRAKRIEKRLKNYSVKSENLVNKFMEDIIFVLDHLTRPNKSDKKKGELSSPFLFNPRVYFLK